MTESSISVTDLTKRYGSVVAVDRISFSIEPGEVVGFLGPNGAGKTTTIRILSCFMPASSGSASVAGFDVFKRSIEVRRRLGYLPENVPLYPEMRVREYLAFRAALKMSASRADRRRRIGWAVDRCGIGDVTHKLIGTLSKGYRQRVGIADTIVHDPEVIILDEPTVGLDPNQTRDVRELVKELARTKTESGLPRTILFSTHIIPWVEKVCERVLIIDRGTILADGLADDLVARLGGVVKVRVRAEGEAEAILPALRACPLATSVDNLSLGVGETSAVLWGARANEDELKTFVNEAVSRNGGSIRDLRSESIDLEDVFRHWTHAEERKLDGAVR